VYSRVAKLLGLDRSYVSRVASGQRRSKKVEAALLAEIKRIEKIAGKRAAAAKAAGA
jgi:predicted transcriptional regulator